MKLLATFAGSAEGLVDVTSTAKGQPPFSRGDFIVLLRNGKYERYTIGAARPDRENDAWLLLDLVRDLTFQTF